MYSIIDMATCGGRVTEVAVVRADRFGRVTDEWSSLINPGHEAMPPGPVRGAGPAELRLAPVFGDLAGRLASLLRSRAVVAHNLAVRGEQLTAEFARIGFVPPLRGLCTMRLARHFLPTASRGLDACLAGAGLPPHRTDAPLDDARAAAALLGYYLRAAGYPPPWLPVLDDAAAEQWPALPPVLSAGLPRCRTGARPRGFLTLAVDRLPRSADPVMDAYGEVLDRAVLDGRPLDASAAAVMLGADTAEFHRRYLRDLAVVAVDLGMVVAGRDDLCRAAAVLGAPDPAGAVDEALARAVQQSSDDSPWMLQPGDTVVFHGAMNPSRERWQSEAQAAGLVVGNAVTRRTRFLVTADPDSRTGNAEKARRYQVPIVHPAAYREILKRTNNRVP